MHEHLEKTCSGKERSEGQSLHDRLSVCKLEELKWNADVTGNRAEESRGLLGLGVNSPDRRPKRRFLEFGV